MNVWLMYSNVSLECIYARQRHTPCQKIEAPPTEFFRRAAVAINQICLDVSHIRSWSLSSKNFLSYTVKRVSGTYAQLRHALIRNTEIYES